MWYLSRNFIVNENDVTSLFKTTKNSFMNIGVFLVKGNVINGIAYKET